MAFLFMSKPNSITAETTRVDHSFHTWEEKFIDLKRQRIIRLSFNQLMKLTPDEFDTYSNIVRWEDQDWWCTYEMYMESTEWQEIRTMRVEFDNNQCHYCGAKRGLQVHHLTYDHVGNERIKDLVTVCKPCHQNLHKNKEL